MRITTLYLSPSRSFSFASRFEHHFTWNGKEADCYALSTHIHIPNKSKLCRKKKAKTKSLQTSLHAHCTQFMRCEKNGGSLVCPHYIWLWNVFKTWMRIVFSKKTKFLANLLITIGFDVVEHFLSILTLWLSFIRFSSFWRVFSLFFYIIVTTERALIGLFSSSIWLWIMYLKCAHRKF